MYKNGMYHTQKKDLRTMKATQRVLCSTMLHRSALQVDRFVASFKEPIFQSFTTPRALQGIVLLFVLQSIVSAKCLQRNENRISQ